MAEQANQMIGQLSLVDQLAVFIRIFAIVAMIEIIFITQRR